jgi:hypothetical protein
MSVDSSCLHIVAVEAGIDRVFVFRDERNSVAPVFFSDGSVL